MKTSAYIPPKATVMTPTGRKAVVVRYTPDDVFPEKQRAICRYLDDNDTVSLLPDLLMEVD